MKSHDVFLRHILDEIDFLLDQVKSLTFEKFVSNEVMKRACTRSFEIMGGGRQEPTVGFQEEAQGH